MRIEILRIGADSDVKEIPYRYVAIGCHLKTADFLSELEKRFPLEDWPDDAGYDRSEERVRHSYVMKNDFSGAESMKQDGAIPATIIDWPDKTTPLATHQGLE